MAKPKLTTEQRFDLAEIAEIKRIQKAQKKKAELEKRLKARADWEKSREGKKELKAYRKERKEKTEFDIAKHEHKRVVRKKKIRKWKREAEFEKRPVIIQTLTKRKKGKRGTSPIGQAAHKVLFPVKPLKKHRW